MLSNDNNSMQNDQTQHKQTSSDERGRVAQSVTIVLTVVGILLLIFVGSKAVGQASGMEYVEGKQYYQDRVNPFIASTHSGFTNQPASLLNAVKPSTPNNVADSKIVPAGPENHDNSNKEVKVHEPTNSDKRLKPSKLSRQER